MSSYCNDRDAGVVIGIGVDLSLTASTQQVIMPA